MQDIQALFSRIDWEDAFIKSVNFESPTSIDDGSIIAPEGLGDLEIVLGTTDSEYPALLLRCRRVHEFKMSFSFDLDPKVRLSGGRVRVQLLRMGEEAVEAEDVEVETLSEL
jgi:hypothetical protein